MAMEIGGDDSVAWTVTHHGPLEEERDRQKRTLHELHPKKDAFNVRKGDRYLEGRDPSNTDGKSFTIKLKLPKTNGAAFQAAVEAAAKAPVGGAIVITLPIEARNYDQIKIDW
jgi:hypothetical protein